jgi:hypothetical protein
VRGSFFSCFTVWPLASEEEEEDDAAGSFFLKKLSMELIPFAELGFSWGISTKSDAPTPKRQHGAMVPGTRLSRFIVAFIKSAKLGRLEFMIADLSTVICGSDPAMLSTGNNCFIL